ncbi:MAG: acyltransferase [Flavobacteriaceae bacterium]|nr:acyltransferase [Flavobacteriaceae bacterium]
MDVKKENLNKLYKLDAVRGFAAVYVVFHHLFASGIKVLNVDFSLLFRFGQEAVILFFVLSGFVIYYSYNNQNNISLSLFFKKRFLRIYVPVILVFVANYGLLCYNEGGFVDFSIKELIGNLFMLQDLIDKRPNVLVAPFLGNIPLWSLSYEWYFYFIFFFVHKKLNNSSITVYGIGIAAAVFYSFLPNFIFRELMYFSIWWVGVDFAKLYLRGEKINFLNVRSMLFAIFAICLVLFFTIINKGALGDVYKEGGIGEYPWIEFRHFLFTFLLIIIIVLWKKIKWFGFDFLVKPFMYVAPISFGIYISHWFLVYTATYFSFIENTNVRLIAYMLVCVLFSYLIEIRIFPMVKKRLL